MSPQKTVKGLRDAFPRLFAGDCEITCMDGWADLLHRFCAEIQAYLDAYPDEAKGFAVLQIKEKAGGLSYYYTMQDFKAGRVIDQIIRKYAAKADHTCEYCGAPGRLRQHFWIKTLCDACDADYGREEDDEYRENLIVSGRPRSLKEVAEIIELDGKFSLVLNEFLDEFYREQQKTVQYEMLSDEPPIVDPMIDAYLAAVAEHFSYHLSLGPTPEWATNEETRFLDKPWFADSGVTGLRPLLIKESPLAFRRRWLFVSANALSRA